MQQSLSEVKPQRPDRSEFTRKALLLAARELFATQGFADTATEQIVQLAGVTRGALYYQFRDKQDLFREVYHQLEKELADGITSRFQELADGAPSAWQEVREGSQAFLDVCLDRDIQRIALLEAPAVLGRDASRDISRFGLSLIRRGLQRSIDQGFIPPQPVEPLAHLVRAALIEGAMLIARADDHDAARIEVGAAVDRLIGGLAASSDSP